MNRIQQLYLTRIQHDMCIYSIKKNNITYSHVILRFRVTVREPNHEINIISCTSIYINTQ